MAQTTKERDLLGSPSPVRTPPEGSSNGCSSNYDDVDLGADERPASGDMSPNRSRYDERGFLVGFENSTAYTRPRPAPSPTNGCIPVLKAARSPPSTPPDKPLPLLPLQEPLIVVPYQSTLTWSSEPPSSLPTTPVKLTEAYRNRCLNQYLDGKQPTSSRRGRYNLQGYWLGRRTLRGFVQQRQEKGLEEAATRTTTQSTPEDNSGSPRALWSRVRDSVRRSNTLTRWSLSNSFPELARTVERVGYQPPF
ncbi:hypothetical protein PV04_04881 [Phialophora macrospora]|uniref:Uncharacterized protein n=1 Tax=Phialophora macrospora TaxID=1851006 RepID=A0A0D2FLH0_9EURO|nr:hypothetical protein PV04_04881 [Phialophora macrospora]